MQDKDKIIDSLRIQLAKAESKISALEQENALLNFQIENKTEIFNTDSSVVPKKKTL